VQRLDVPVLGFVGAPFTLCSYLIDGGRSRDLAELKTFMWSETEAWNRLAGFWAEHMAEFAIAQHEAGAGAVQVFDSWAARSPGRLRGVRVPAHAHDLRADGSGRRAEHQLLQRQSGAAAGLVARSGRRRGERRLAPAHRRSLAHHRRGPRDPGQPGPVALLAGEEFALRRTKDILDRVGGRPGHIFNLGHGILPGTDWRVARAVIDFVHEYTRPPLAAAALHPIQPWGRSAPAAAPTP
jgi:uroporphyrinogen decarboxylase